MSALFDETRRTLTGLAGQRMVHVSACWRASQNGILGHVLESTSVGREWLATERAFSRWLFQIRLRDTVTRTRPTRSSLVGGQVVGAASGKRRRGSSSSATKSAPESSSASLVIVAARLAFVLTSSVSEAA